MWSLNGTQILKFEKIPIRTQFKKCGTRVESASENLTHPVWRGGGHGSGVLHRIRQDFAFSFGHGAGVKIFEKRT